MSKLVTITSLSGSQPYYVYLCDGAYLNCMYLINLNDTDIPYSFLVPSPYLSLNEVGIKVIDNNNCEIKNKVSI